MLAPQHNVVQSKESPEITAKPLPCTYYKCKYPGGINLETLCSLLEENTPVINSAWSAGERGGICLHPISTTGSRETKEI